MSGRITGPEILEERIDYMDSKSIWYYIEVINQCLLTNQVETDGTIYVTIKYNINSEFIDKIVNMYEAAGWATVNVTLTGSENSLYGTTKFEFIPPTLLAIKVKRKVRDNL
jgi:hypothetical protein